MNQRTKKVSLICFLYAFLAFFTLFPFFFLIPFELLIVINVFGILPYFLKKYLKTRGSGTLVLEKIDYYFLAYPVMTVLYLWTYLIGWQFILYDFLSPLLTPIGEPLRIFMRNYIAG